MKKFLSCLFAAMLFVPTFSGCGQSTEGEVLEDTGESTTGDKTDDEYEKMMNEADQKAQEESGQ